MLLPVYPARPWLGKEANALLYWLVLRTAPYELIMSSLQMYKLIVHVILPRKGNYSGIDSQINNPKSTNDFGLFICDSPES